MLKTLDILIGAVMVLLLFSMAVTVITQAVTSLFQQRGKHLLDGLTSLLQQLGVSTRDLAAEIAKAVLTHPALTTVPGKLATVVHRGEFTKLLMDVASGQSFVQLEQKALDELKQMLAKQGVPDPAKTLSNIRTTALQIETVNPQLATHVREQMAILKECATDYVAKVNFWFDQTMDRVSQAFTQHALRVTVAVAFLVVLVVQLDIIAVVDRLSIDQQFRDTIVAEAAKTVNANAQNPNDPKSYNIDTRSYYNFLNTAGLITLPTNKQWPEQLSDPRRYPGMIISILLLSLGAPFWYNILKKLLGLRSILADKDDQQRAQRQSSQISPTTGSSAPASDA